MSKKNLYNFTPLAEPMPIREQQWPKDTVPLLHTRTMAFNHEKYIEQCLEGILMQNTTFPVQVLIHDDASTDKTVAIIDEDQRRYPNLIKAYYQSENSHSKSDKEERRAEFRSWRIGKYEAMCEGDDYWTDPYKLQKQVDILESHPEFSMCFHNSLVIHEDNSRESHEFTKIIKTEYDVVDIIDSNWFIPTQSIVYRAAMYNSLNQPKWTSRVFGGDLALQLVLATKGKIIAINETMAVYRKHKTSLSHNKMVGYHQLKIIETLSFFNYYTDFQYNVIIQNKIKSIRENLYQTFLAKLPIWNKIINPDYIKYRFKTLK